MNSPSCYPYTFITCASSGLGKALAIECAKRGRNLILVALPNDGLEILSKRLMHHFHIDVVDFGLDLTDPVSLRIIQNDLNHLST